MAACRDCMRCCSEVFGRDPTAKPQGLDMHPISYSSVDAMSGKMLYLCPLHFDDNEVEM